MKPILHKSYHSQLEIDFIKGKTILENLEDSLSLMDSLRLQQICPYTLVATLGMIFYGIILAGAGEIIGMVILITGALWVSLKTALGSKRLSILYHYQTLYLLGLVVFDDEEEASE